MCLLSAQSDVEHIQNFLEILEEQTAGKQQQVQVSKVQLLYELLLAGKILIIRIH